MKLRNTFLMAVVLAVLAGFVYFYEIRGREEREEAERIEGLLLDFDTDDVASLTLETGEGLVEITRDEDHWRIQQPYLLDADDSAVDSLLRQLSSAEQERLVLEDAEDLAPFGLDAPPVRVALLIAGEEGEEAEALSLQIGGGTPVGYNVYVMRGDERDIYMTPAALKDNLDKSLFDLRDKQVLEFEDSEVEGIDIRSDTYEVSLRREAEDWRITAPVATRADGDSVSTALRRLRTDRASAFVAEQPAEEEIEAFGLAAPRHSVTLWTTGEASQTIDIGLDSEEPSGVFARRRGSEPVFVVPESLVDAVFPASIDDLRSRSVVDVERDRIGALELEHGGQSYRLEQRGGEWRVAEPRDLEADASGVSTVLTSFVNLSAEGFAEGTADDPRYGLDAPHLTLMAHMRATEVDEAATTDEDATTEEDQETGAEPDQPAPRAIPEGQRREVLVMRVGGATEIEPDPEEATTTEGEESEEGEETGEPEMIAVRYVAMSGDPTVYLVRDDAIEPFRVDLLDLRAKTLVSFTQEELTRIELVSQGALYDLEKRDDSWIRTGQQEGEIEATRISDLLWNLNYLRMEDVAAEWDAGASPPDLAGFGLATPAFRITAYVGDQRVADVHLGEPVPTVADEAPEAGGETPPPEQVYALVGNDTAVFQIGARLRDAAESLAAELAGGR